MSNDVSPGISGEVLASMRTTPSAAMMMHAATTKIGAPADVAAAAIDALRSGSAVAYVLSGKLASGKDAVAAASAEQLAAAGFAPANCHRSSDAIRDELRDVIAVVADSVDERRAVEAVQLMGVPSSAAQHLVDELFVPTRHASQLPVPEERTDWMRHLLQYHADYGRRSVDEDWWVRAMFTSALESLAAGRSAYIAGIRYPNEIAPAMALGFMTVRLAVGRKVQEARLRARDGLDPLPELLDNTNECALDDYPGFNLIVRNDGPMGPTVARTVEYMMDHVAALVEDSKSAQAAA